MIRTLSIAQIVLGVLLILPPTYYFVRVKPQLCALAGRSKADGEVIATSLRTGAELTGSLADTFQIIGDKSTGVADGLDKIPFKDWIGYIEPVANGIRNIGNRVKVAGGTLKESSATLSTGENLIRDYPKAITNLQGSASAMSFVALIAGFVVVLNGLQLSLLAGKLTQPGVA